ncbi:tetratricopeptide repeat domain 5 [Strigomonas culicis]|nr:tetratricopeptide repeat domain 5 [Strigomonas culicis]EPY31493.1 tetratricopeptide repeat domain 5 [Strigomonas culicis]|eukprot:EPY22284.1 tetratricopeptide repeat domain 5 [Strigomonas culicis]
MQNALEKAREAVRTDVTSADAWNAVALTLLAQLTLDGMSYTGLRKAMAAMQQAVDKDKSDPDIHYNKGVLGSLMGSFDEAVRDFARAYELDNHRQKGTRRLCEDNLVILQRAQTRIKNLNSIGRSELKKLCGTVKKEEAHLPGAQTQCVVVVDTISDQTMQPLTLMTIDSHESFGLLFLYGISFSALKIGDVLSFPLSEKQGDAVYHVDRMELLGNEPIEVSMKKYFVNNETLLVNHKPLSPSAKASLQVSSRLFA